MFDFDNIAFSKSPHLSDSISKISGHLDIETEDEMLETDFRLLSCAACDAGPLGYAVLRASPPGFFLVASRLQIKPIPISYS